MPKKRIKVPKQCVVCSREFTPRENGARNIVCSESCARVRHGVQSQYGSCVDCGKQTKIHDGSLVICRRCDSIRQRTHRVTCGKCGTEFNAKVEWAKWCESCVGEVQRQQRRARNEKRKNKDGDADQMAALSGRIGTAGEYLFDAVMARHGMLCCKSISENQATWDRLISLNGELVYVQVKTARGYIREGCCKVSHAKAMRTSGALVGLAVLQDASVHICSSDAILGSADRATVDIAHGGLLSLWLDGAKWSAGNAEKDTVHESCTATCGQVDEVVQPITVETFASGVQEAEPAMCGVPGTWDYECSGACGPHHSAQRFTGTVLGQIELAGVVPFMP